MGDEPKTDRGPESRPRDPFTVFLMLACVALSLVVFFLARQNRQLKAELGAAGTPRLPAGALKPGDTVEPFALLDESGARVAIGFAAGGPRTLLLVFSSRCPACEKTLPIWNEILAAATPKDCRVVGVRTDGDAPGSSSLFTPALRFPVHTVPEPAPPPFAGPGLPYVPAAVLLDGEGRVSRVWFGVPAESDRRELRDALAG
jgi:hypothetical protein